MNVFEMITKELEEKKEAYLTDELQERRGWTVEDITEICKTYKVTLDEYVQYRKTIKQ